MATIDQQSERSIADAPVVPVVSIGVKLLHLRGHLPALDGLRGLAIVLVMLCHFLPNGDQPASLIGRAFFFIARCGWCGVDLFFVLSGFLITGILLDSKGSSHFFRNFYARRTLRIFPLYYFVLAAVFIVVPLFWHRAFASPDLAEIRHRQGWLWLYGTNVLMTRKNDIDIFYSGWLDLNPFWSLAVEEHFYLIWPAIVFFCDQKRLKWVCYACIVGSLFLRGAMAMHKESWEWGVYVFTPCRVDALAVGGLLAVWMRETPQWAGTLLAGAKWMALGLGIFWLGTLAANPARDDVPSMTLGYSLAGAFFAALLLAALAAPPTGLMGRLFNGSVLRGLGKYSYGLYVYHVILGSPMSELFGREKLKPLFSKLHFGSAAYGASVLSYMILATIVSFAVAWVSWNLFEKRFLTLKKYFENKSNGSSA